MIKAIIFDLDNTLIDFMRMKHMSCDAAMNAMIGAGLDIKKKQAMEILFDLYNKHTLEEKKIFQYFLKKVTGKVDYRILAAGIVAYREVRTGLLSPYPGTHYTLLKLRDKGIKLGIITDAPRLKAWIRLSSMKLSNFFDEVVTYDDTKRRKPDPRPYKLMLKRINLSAQECIMVGDRPNVDLKGAEKVGMKTAFAKYGHSARKAKADFILKDIRELIKIV